jgi:hypothetical protein
MIPSLTARFRSLRNDDVSPDIDRPLCVLKRLHLAEQRNAGALHPWREWRRIREALSYAVRVPDRARPDH